MDGVTGVLVSLDESKEKKILPQKKNILSVLAFF